MLYIETALLKICHAAYTQTHQPTNTPRCCEKLMVCKAAVLNKVGLVQQRAQRKYANEHTDEENARYINKQMERLGLI